MLKTLCVMTRLSLFPEILKNHYQTLYNEYDYIKYLDSMQPQKYQTK